MRRKWVLVPALVLLTAGGVGLAKWQDERSRRDACDNDFLYHDLQDKGGLATEDAWALCSEQYGKCLKSEDPHAFTACMARANGNAAEVRACR